MQPELELGNFEQELELDNLKKELEFRAGFGAGDLEQELELKNLEQESSRRILSRSWSRWSRSWRSRS